MLPELQIIEVNLLEGKLFLTFADGKSALIEPSVLRAYAQDPQEFTDIPIASEDRVPQP